MLERGNVLAAATPLDEKLNGFVGKQGNDFDAHLYKPLSPCAGRKWSAWSSAGLTGIQTLALPRHGDIGMRVSLRGGEGTENWDSARGGVVVLGYWAVRWIECNSEAGSDIGVNIQYPEAVDTWALAARNEIKYIHRFTQPAGSSVVRWGRTYISAVYSDAAKLNIPQRTGLGNLWCLGPARGL